MAVWKPTFAKVSMTIFLSLSSCSFVVVDIFNVFRFRGYRVHICWAYSRTLSNVAWAVFMKTMRIFCSRRIDPFLSCDVTELRHWHIGNSFFCANKLMKASAHIEDSEEFICYQYACVNWLIAERDVSNQILHGITISVLSVIMTCTEIRRETCANKYVCYWDLVLGFVFFIKSLFIRSFRHWPLRRRSRQSAATTTKALLLATTSGVRWIVGGGTDIRLRAVVCCLLVAINSLV